MLPDVIRRCGLGRQSPQGSRVTAETGSNKENSRPQGFPWRRAMAHTTFYWERTDDYGRAGRYDADHTDEIAAMGAEQGGTDGAPEAERAYQSMEELLEQEVGFRGLQTGEIITGTVERIDEHGALVNVGAKSEGLVPPEELGARHAETINVGDEIAVYVVDNGTRGGNIILSKKKADYERAWNNIIKAYENNETLTAMVIDRVKGGLVVDLVSFYREQKGLTGKVLGGWEWSGTATYASGLPLTVAETGNRSGTGNAGRPNLVGPLNIQPRNVSAYFNTAAFAPRRSGNLGTKELIY